MPKHWTTSEDKNLIAAFLQHKAEPNIDQVILDTGAFPGKTRNSIANRRRKLNARKYRWTITEKGEKINHSNEFDPMKALDENQVKGLPIYFRDDIPNETSSAGSFVIFVYEKNIQIQSRNMVPREVVKVLAKVIDRLV